MNRRCDVATSTDDMTPARRRSQLASILAQAALRLRARAALAPDSGDTGATGANSGETLSNLTRTPLDLRADKCVHGDGVVDARERARPGGSP